MAPSVVLANLDPIPMAVVRRRAKGPELGKAVQEGCGTVWQFLRAKGLKGGRNIAVYLNGNVDVEVGVEFAGDFVEDGEVVRSHTPAGSAVTATHFGPYQTLGQTYAAIHAWCKEHGVERGGVSWELYGHWQKEWDNDPSKIQTDVFWQVLSGKPQ